VTYVGGLVVMYSREILFLCRQGPLESGMPSEASLTAMEFRVKFRSTNSSACTAKYSIRSAALPSVVELILLTCIPRIFLYEYKVKSNLSGFGS
jgi:hypothetical protein